ncbi:60S ribosomal protein L18a-like protein isoform X2 [Capsicum annuum]|uniref:60S ribosomal protein L18a-like protein isoform X2 n=1 Tax=Capsicum annuum TaxID=4072 RepID=UPI0007BF4D15|nr:60S ribosomal protein L18a-like protein isoform X2 [Capsicum annuum]
MSEEGGKMNRDTAAPATAIAVSGEPLLANYCYGTFQGVASYQSPPPLQSHPVFGFPQPIPPPAVCAVPPCYFPHGYQTVQGYAVAEGRPIREHRLPCCGMGIGWFLFIIGCFLGAIPWYIGAFLLLCVRLDYREKPGFIACTLAATLALVAMTLGATKASYLCLYIEDIDRVMLIHDICTLLAMQF